jgi:uncharacterized peroxidase-related enzyme
MPRFNPLTIETAPEAAKPLLTSVKSSLGMVPNLMATLAHAPAALQSYLAFSQTIATGALSPALREQIALAVASENNCAYCASAHTLLGKNAGVAPEELARNLKGDSTDSRTRAALIFARAIVAKRGWADDDDLASLRAAGFSDSDAIEILAVVILNTFTNYFNHLASTDIDFPIVALPQSADACEADASAQHCDAPSPEVCSM